MYLLRLLIKHLSLFLEIRFFSSYKCGVWQSKLFTYHIPTSVPKALLLLQDYVIIICSYSPIDCELHQTAFL